MNDLKKVSPKRTLCEVAREVQDQVDLIRITLEDSSDSVLRCVLSRYLVKIEARVLELMEIGKKINRKMYKYSKAEQADWWDANPEYEASLKRRLGLTIEDVEDCL